MGGFEDYLRQHQLHQWDKDHPRTIKLREYLRSEDFDKNPMRFVAKLNPGEYCNLRITLINQATYLLNRILEKQQQQFLRWNSGTDVSSQTGIS